MLRILTQRKTGFFAWKCVEFFTQSLGGAEDAEVGWIFEEKERCKFFAWCVAFFYRRFGLGLEMERNEKF
jgi:hypothetical protein